MKWFGFVFGLWTSVAFAVSQDSSRLLVHLLGYIALDYPGAVEHGRVISKVEYDEMVEFAATVQKILSESPALRDRKDTQAILRTLEKAIHQKSDAPRVAELAKKAQSQVIEVTGLAISPTKFPNHHRGKALYEKNCALCHGVQGDGTGPGGRTLNPPPSDFTSAKMSDISPFQAFNSIRLGVPGTAMAAFAPFTDEQVWDLAFYVVGLRHEKVKTKAEPDLAQVVKISLDQIASVPDSEFQQWIVGSEEVRAATLREIRLGESRAGRPDFSLAVAQEKLNESLRLSAEGKWQEAKYAAISAYLDGVEPAEPELRNLDANLVLEIEKAMARVRTDIVDKVAVADIEKSVAAARRQIELGQKRLKQKDSSPWFTFSVAAGIFLREGFEAVLILVTLLGVVRTMGSRRALAAIHLGWGVALGLGLVFWASSGWLMSVSGAQRETLEGVIGAIAVLVLLYLGFWLHRKTEIGKWHDFIKTMVNEAMENRKVMALGLVSFTAVFREVFETVLFLRALTLEAGPSQQWAMLAGVVASFIVVILLALAMLRFSAKLPLRQLFGISSAVMIFLAVVLTGKAMHAFQETGLVTMTNTPFEFRLDLLGIYPTFETLVPQFLLVVLCLVVWLLPRRMLLSSPTENSV